MADFEFKEDDNENYLESLGEKINTEVHAEKKVVQPTSSLPALIDILPELLQEMHKRGIPFSLEGVSGNISVDGFYKNGPMVLKMDENFEFEAIDKRNRSVPIKSVDDLVKLNFDWWRRSAGKSGNFANPTKPWIDEFQQKGLVKRQYIVIPVDDGSESFYDE